MESKSKNLSLNGILIVIAIGIWAIVLQNAGVIPTNQNVKVVNEVDAYVRGSVDVDGSVSVANTVDVNLDKVLGYPVGCHKSYTIDGKEYQAIDVYSR